MSIKNSALIIGISAGAIILFPSFVFAQTTGTTMPPLPPHAQNIGSPDQGHFPLQGTRDLFMQKLKLIKDEHKQTLVTEINDKIPLINTSETTQMNNSLNNMSTILPRISAQANILKAQGKNTSAVDTAIAAAQNAIITAQTAVTAQAAKQYTVSITSEKTLRSTIGLTISGLRQNLITTQQTVKAARLAVLKAYQALVTITAGPITASGSAQPLTIKGYALPVQPK